MQALLSEPHPIFRSMVDDCGDDDDDSGLFSSSFAYYRGNSVDKLEKFWDWNEFVIRQFSEWDRSYYIRNDAAIHQINWSFRFYVIGHFQK